MRIGVVGATGALGRQVIPRLIERGHAARAIVRRESEVARLRRLGVDAMPGDILDPHSLSRGLEGCDAALHLAMAIPRGGTPSPDWALHGPDLAAGLGTGFELVQSSLVIHRTPSDIPQQFLYCRLRKRA